jgi:hypothetical protein
MRCSRLEETERSQRFARGDERPRCVKRREPKGPVLRRDDVACSASSGRSVTIARRVP